MKLYSFGNEFIKETYEYPDNFTGIIEFSDSSKYWYLKGMFHRLDGPAIEYSVGTKEWYIKGILHRLDGPAIEFSDGGKFWYIDGKQVTEEQCKCLHDIMKLKGLI